MFTRNEDTESTPSPLAYYTSLKKAFAGVACSSIIISLGPSKESSEHGTLATTGDERKPNWKREGKTRILIDSPCVPVSDHFNLALIRSRSHKALCLALVDTLEAAWTSHIS